MFDIFYRKKQPLFEGLCDIHNHILPNIDDGSTSINMSNKMINNYIELGFSEIIPTPHVYKDLYPNTPKTIKESYDLFLKNIVRKKECKINSYAAEYMVDEEFIRNLKIDKPKLLIDNRFVLIEVNFMGEVNLLEQACFYLLKNNIRPILAHPERYFLIDNISKYKELKKRGLYFQLNILSLLGNYGKIVKKKSEEILRLGLYDFVATDAHNHQHISILKSLKLTKRQLINWEEIREFQMEIFKR